MSKQYHYENLDLLYKIISKNFGLNVDKLEEVYSYFGGVAEITTDTNKKYIVKMTRNADNDNFQHHEAVAKFCDFVEANVTEFVSQKFLKTKEGNTLVHFEEDDYFSIVEKREIITKYGLTVDEQLELGNLIRVFHSKMQNLKLDGIRNTSWMTSFTNEDIEILKLHFSINEIEEYVKPIEYEALDLEKFLIHGDLHQGNISFTQPPFIYDLDSLSYGSRVEDIARTITHWRFGRPKFELIENIVKGYQILPQNEIDLIPIFMIRICYKKVCEFTRNDDQNNANGYKALSMQLKEKYELK